MPLYRYYCQNCADEHKLLLQPRESQLPQACPNCNKWLWRQPTGASPQVVERIDNGLMPRAVERHRDAVEMYRERAKEGK